MRKKVNAEKNISFARRNDRSERNKNVLTFQRSCRKRNMLTSGRNKWTRITSEHRDRGEMSEIDGA